MIQRPLAIWALLVISLGCSAYGDSVFDVEGTGRDLMPVAGNTRALGGAVVAGDDPISSSILSPFASALADRITIGAGFAHTGTRSTYLGEQQRTITTLFPSVTVIVPVRGMSFLTGLFQEKGGRLTLVDNAKLYGIELFDVTYRKETSIHSVPLIVTKAVLPRLTLSAGIVWSFFDTRETTTTDFRSVDRTDAEDVHDLFASGQSFAAGFLVDLDLVRVAALYRSKSDLDGTLESRNRYAGLYSSQDTGLGSDHAFNVGVLVEPAPFLQVEADYHESPWDKLSLGERRITDKNVARWAVGVRYRGERLWKASRYPLMAGYYRQPLDWEGPTTGEIVEEFFSVGTSIPVGEDRAALSISFEVGTRRADRAGDIEETIYGVSLSVTAGEAWRRGIRR